MLRFVQNTETRQLEVIQEPPYEEILYASACVQPDPCPGCGNCRLCDSKCTCGFKHLETCPKPYLCDEKGKCLWPVSICGLVKEETCSDDSGTA